MTLDQGNITFDYDPKPTNGRWLDSEDGCEGEVMFCAETLGLKEGPPIKLADGIQPGPGIPLRFSPFIETFRLFRDIQAFQRLQAERFRALRAVDVIGRLVVHLENQDWTLLDAQLKALGFPGPLSTPTDRLIALRLVLVELSLPRFSGQVCYATCRSEIASNSLSLGVM